MLLLVRTWVVAWTTALSISLTTAQAPNLAAIEDWPGLAAALRAAIAGTTQPGFFGSVLVVRDDRVVLREGFGTAGPAGRAAAPDTLYDVGSIAKQFTATAILRLQDRGRLTIRDSLGDLFRDVPPDMAKIRLHDLLTHTSGLPRNVEGTPTSRNDRDAWLAEVWRAPLTGEPGEFVAYSNAGYGVLAAVIEVVSRQRFEDYIQREVFRPAGMASSGFCTDPDLDPGRAADRRERQVNDRDHESALVWPWHWAFRGATGVVTTVDDLALWDRALRDDVILVPGTRELLLRPKAREFAYGWEVARTPRGTRRIDHSGAVYGFRSSIARFPDERGLIVVLGNPFVDLSELGITLERLLFAAGPPTDLRRVLAGRYRSDDGDELSIEVGVDGVRMTARGARAVARVRYGSHAHPDDRTVGTAADRRVAALVAALSAPSNRDALALFETPEAADLARKRWRSHSERHGRCRAATVIAGDPSTATTHILATFGDLESVWAVRWNQADAAQICACDDMPRRPQLAPDWLYGERFRARSLDGLEDIDLQFELDRDHDAAVLWTDAAGSVRYHRQ